MVEAAEVQQIEAEIEEFEKEEARSKEEGTAGGGSDYGSGKAKDAGGG